MTHCDLAAQQRREPSCGDVKRGVVLDIRTRANPNLLDIATQPRDVDIDTGSGDVELGVVAGSYRVVIDIGAVDQQVPGIDRAPGAASTTRLHTGSGYVRITGT